MPKDRPSCPHKAIAQENPSFGRINKCEATTLSLTPLIVHYKHLMVWAPCPHKEIDGGKPIPLGGSASGDNNFESYFPCCAQQVLMHRARLFEIGSVQNLDHGSLFKGYKSVTIDASLPVKFEKLMET